MRRSGKGYSVLDNIGSAVGNSPNMGSMHLRITFYVDHTQSGNRATVAVGLINRVTKTRISYYAIRQYGFHTPIPLSRWRWLVDCVGSLTERGQRDAQTFGISNIKRMFKARCYKPREVFLT